MCIISCYPLRAGHEFIAEVKSDLDNIDSIAKQRNIFLGRPNQTTKKGYIYQGALILGRPNTKKPLPRSVCLTDSTKQEVLTIFSKNKNIKSHLHGSAKFTMPHWFIEDDNNKFILDNSTIDDSIIVSKIDNAKDILKRYKDKTLFHKTKTNCFFITEKILDEYRKLEKSKLFFGETFPELFWCSSYAKNILRKTRKDDIFNKK